MKHRRFRVTAAVALVAIVGGSVAAVGATAGDNSPPGQDQYKLTICHHTGSEDTNPTVTIDVSNTALPAHLAHGDTIGPCRE